MLQTGARFAVFGGHASQSCQRLKTPIYVVYLSLLALLSSPAVRSLPHGLPVMLQGDPRYAVHLAVLDGVLLVHAVPGEFVVQRSAVHVAVLERVLLVHVMPGEFVVQCPAVHLAVLEWVLLVHAVPAEFVVQCSAVHVAVLEWVLLVHVMPGEFVVQCPAVHLAVLEWVLLVHAVPAEFVVQCSAVHVAVQEIVLPCPTPRDTLSLLLPTLLPVFLLLVLEHCHHLCLYWISSPQE